MNVSDSPAPQEGAWIFVSHSHGDVLSVRRVRDALEAKGHQPLLFFLKCLSDDAEIDDLIRREIEARQFFLLCGSTNARASRWVQQEVRLISELDGRVALSLELDGEWEAQLAAIDELSRRATVFMSYAALSHPCNALASELGKALRANDYRVSSDFQSLNPGQLWRQALTDALDEAMDDGYLLLLLSPETFETKGVRLEVDYALRSRATRGLSANVVPIIAAERERTLSLLGSWPSVSAALSPLDFTTGEFSDNFAALRRVLAP